METRHKAGHDDRSIYRQHLEAMVVTDLKGAYRILNDLHMRKRANQTDDPRHVFYIAGLTSQTYEEYLAKVGDIEVFPKTHPSSGITGRREIKWWRDQRWIADV